MAFGFETTANEIVDSFRDSVSGKACEWKSPQNALDGQ